MKIDRSNERSAGGLQTKDKEANLQTNQQIDDADSRRVKYYIHMLLFPSNMYIKRHKLLYSFIFSSAENKK